ncbi:MAG: hypothetical protein NVS4B3_23330 [Gemmatimonadaceae bacterium]
MRPASKLLILPAMLLAGACTRTDDRKVDDALRNDLALASSVQPYQPQQFASPQELSYGQPQYQPVRGGYAMPVYQPAPQTGPVYRTSASRPSSRTVYRYPAEPIRHTQRDAAIGAAAGAVIGASTSGDRLKGGLIGAAAGGLLGAIVGHTVDVSH